MDIRAEKKEEQAEITEIYSRKIIYNQTKQIIKVSIWSKIKP